MLVLIHRQSQAVLFPSSDIQIRGHTVKPGLDPWLPRSLDVGKPRDAIPHRLSSAPARN